MSPQPDGMKIVAIVLLMIMGLSLVTDKVENVTASPLYTPTSASRDQAKEPLASPAPGDPAVFVAPYTDYTLTQGLHGYSYGHMAIDLGAGKGTEILSPIHGVVTELYIDEYGNPTLVIENEYYQVTLLHGAFSVAIGEQLNAGQTIGTESNLGYTTDLQGRSCQGRDCGYHTHLNVFDKRLGANVNPLELIEK